MGLTILKWGDDPVGHSIWAFDNHKIVMVGKMNYEYSNINYPTWKKYIVLSRTIEGLRVKDKRNIFQMMRVKPNVNEDTFFPMYGFTAGEFATWQVLKDANSRKKG